MTRDEVKRFRRLVEKLDIPGNRTAPTQANFRWMLRNAQVTNGSNPATTDLLQLIRPHA